MTGPRPTLQEGSWFAPEPTVDGADETRLQNGIDEETDELVISLQEAVEAEHPSHATSDRRDVSRAADRIDSSADTASGGAMRPAVKSTPEPKPSTVHAPNGAPFADTRGWFGTLIHWSFCETAKGAAATSLAFIVRWWVVALALEIAVITLGGIAALTIVGLTGGDGHDALSKTLDTHLEWILAANGVTLTASGYLAWRTQPGRTQSKRISGLHSARLNCGPRAEVSLEPQEP